MNILISGLREFIQRVRVTIQLFKKKKAKERSFLSERPKLRKPYIPEGYTPDSAGFNRWSVRLNVSRLAPRR
jgi:hypothetical protein